MADSGVVCSSDDPMFSDTEDLFDSDDGGDPDFKPSDAESSSTDSGDNSTILPVITGRLNPAPDGESQIEADWVGPSEDDDDENSIQFPFLQASVTCNTTYAADSTTEANSSADLEKISGLSTDIREHVGKSSIKIHYCVFCGVGQTRLVRHLLTKHKEEKNMVPFLNAKTKTDKKAELEKLRYAGDYHHNKQVFKEKAGNLVVRRRKNVCVSLDNFTHCPSCYGFFQSKDLYRHKCSSKLTGSRRDLLKKGRLLVPDNLDEQQELDEKLQPIFSAMQADHVSLAARNDPLIRCLGRKEAKRNGFDKDRHSQVRNRLREMGRLLLKLRELSNQENSELKDFITPAGFKLVVESTMKLAGFSDETNDFKSPTLAVKVGHTIKLCADILEAEGIEQGDEVKEANAKGYLKLHSLRWHEEVSAQAYRSQYRNRKGKAKRIPLSKDVAVLAKYLSDRAEDALKRLTVTDGENDDDIRETWIELSELTLTQIILFNRRRQGEASKMKVEDFTNQQHSRDPDVINSLSDFEKKLCEMLTRIEIFGKRGRIVPVLLSASMKEAVEGLIKFRGKAGVSASNNYIFACARYQSDGHIRGSDTLRKFVRCAKLENPEDITSTSLRKQVATLSQVLNLKDNELDLLAQYMGHDVRIHRENYRLPSGVMQLAKVSKLLRALERGELLKNQGRSLDEVSVDDDEECSTDDDQDTPGNDAEDIPTPCGSAEQKLNASDSEEEDSTPSSLNKIAEPTLPASDSDEEHNLPAVPVASSRRKTVCAARRAWSDEEIRAVLKHLDRYILLGQLPGKEVIVKCLEDPALRNRTWRNVKDFVRNRIRKNKCKD